MRSYKKLQYSYKTDNSTIGGLKNRPEIFACLKNATPSVGRAVQLFVRYVYFQVSSLKMKIQSTCEIEDFCRNASFASRVWYSDLM